MKSAGEPQPRVSSPVPGISILMTSAPMSPSIIVQYGPARARVRSRTRLPSRGPAIEHSRNAECGGPGLWTHDCVETGRVQDRYVTWEPHLVTGKQQGLGVRSRGYEDV